MQSAPPFADHGTRPRSRLRWLGAFVVVALLAAFLAVRAQRAGARAAPAHPADGVYRLDDGGLRYTYQAVTNMESLFDLDADPGTLSNLIESRPADAARLRARLMQKLGISDLEELRAAHREQIELLESLGYL